MGVVLWMALLKAQELLGQIRKTSKLPAIASSPCGCRCSNGRRIFTTDDSTAASAAASATASARPSVPFHIAEWHPGGGDRTRRTATNSSGAKRKCTV